MDKGERNARIGFACFVAIAIVVGVIAGSFWAGLGAFIVVLVIWGIIVSIKGPSKTEQKKIDAYKKRAYEKKCAIDEIKSAATAFVADKDNTKYMAVYETERRIEFSSWDKVGFDEIYAVELVIDNQITIEKSGLGRAVVGGIFAGEAGAVVGAVTGTSKQKSKAQKIDVVLKLKNINKPAIVLTYFDYDKVKNFRKEYIEHLRNSMFVFATQIVNTIDAVLVKESNKQSTAVSEGTVIDEIIKAKGLLDSGVITQEEFDAIKANLLK